MESLISQMRRRLSGVDQENRGQTTGSSNTKRSLSFKTEKKKGQNWFSRQFSGQTGWNYDLGNDGEYPTAAAAAAFSIKKLEQLSIQDQPKPDRKLTIKEAMDMEEKTPEKADGSSPPVKKTPPPTKQSTFTGMIGDSEANGWEKTEIAKTKERYEKVVARILNWENKKKEKAKNKFQKTEAELHKRREKTFENKRIAMERIDRIAKGARAQAEENRRNEEIKVKEKANRIRTTGKLPPTCFYF